MIFGIPAIEALPGVESATFANAVPLTTFFLSVRVGVTVTVSKSDAGASTTSSSPVCAAGTCWVFSPKPPARTTPLSRCAFGIVIARSEATKQSRSAPQPGLLCFARNDEPFSSHSPLIPAALMIGHHLSISAL